MDKNTFEKIWCNFNSNEETETIRIYIQGGWKLNFHKQSIKDGKYDIFLGQSVLAIESMITGSTYAVPYSSIAMIEDVSDYSGGYDAEKFC